MKEIILYSEKSYGGIGKAFEIEIIVRMPKLPNVETDNIMEACYTAKNNIKSAVLEQFIKECPIEKERAQNQKNNILACFPDNNIYVEEIPNEYCLDYSNKHLPWFVVTTKVGRIKIGWRRSVINIDWSQTRGTKTPEELFKEEDVTKGYKNEKYIHAWGYDKAKEYINKIINSAQN